MQNTENPSSALLTRLLRARGPGGQEDEVRAICLESLQPLCDEVWVDPAGNVVGLIKGKQSDGNRGRAVKVMAHMDEIAMVVKRVEADGTLRVTALGGANPVNFGMCPVDILGDAHIIPGVLSFGSMHVTKNTAQGADVLAGNVHWNDVHVITRCTVEALRKQGVRPGSRVVLSRHWREPFRVGDAIAAHFLDDRAPIAAVLHAAQRLQPRRHALARDIYLVFTTLEEECNAGAMYAAATLPGDTTIAVEVGPVMEEYGTRLGVDPIINTGDQKGYYTRSVVTDLAAAAERCGYSPQYALLVDFASDASAVMSNGTSAQAGCVAIPTENTHGYELIVEGAIEACAATLVEFLATA
ncbi:peptidase M42 [Pseudomonas poae]|uniref:Peptidase M42 n=1 Tax=Pseudomonas poae TaxID=200451 RepID=A0A423ERM9_9PSED|nr:MULTISPECIES: M28 family peptidase [Pseudomonas]ROM33988.1 peptidase M42 [Pseudomonas poae]TFF14433.1 M28 family peptidase [Pseudomonas sp. JMN1]TFF14883.1 M28 family peptidase [Pseudomonas sp. BCA17]TFF31289.1 M28 family peptidase [Pseudomonas sp. BCA14]TFF32243.1 M28 family peptidase [Pseudomonas sp. BCA13]